MSAPSRAWIDIASSGVTRRRVPSYGETNVAPSSSTEATRRRLTSWKPPLSVRMGPSQPMNAWSPPARSTRSTPGRSARWYALHSTMSAPQARTSSGSSALTVACVPTGMKAGVGTSPWRVRSTPLRAAPSRASTLKTLTRAPPSRQQSMQSPKLRNRYPWASAWS